jgi:hypothetical protein
MPKNVHLSKGQIFSVKNGCVKLPKFGILVLAKFLMPKYRHSISHILVSKILGFVSAKF